MAIVTPLTTQDMIEYSKFCSNKRINLIIPFQIDELQLEILKEKATCQINAIFFSIDELLHKKVVFPYNFDPIVFMGFYQALPKKIILTALLRFQLIIYCLHNDKLIPLSIFKLMKLKLFNFILRAGKKYENKILNIKIFRELSKKIYQYLKYLVMINSPEVDNNVDSTKEFSDLLALVCEENINSNYIPASVILINASLAPGGAERQVVNTLIGLRPKVFGNLTLLCERLDFNTELAFYFPYLKEQDINIEVIAREKLNSLIGTLSLNELRMLGALPAYLADEILSLYVEFKNRRPEIVHAWQDSTSIKSGIAAIMAGVPKIILSTRNVAPYNFAYSQPYMKMAYQALASFKEITIINNSMAGIKDYATWLQLRTNRFTLVRNGVDLSYLKRLSDIEIKNEKTRLGIPNGVPVVGSIFRFYSEKRPLLWIETAIKILEKRSECYFLIAGDGPLKEEMDALIEGNKYKDRFIFLGVQRDIAKILSLLDVFFLTSLYEGTPNVVLEAQWLCVPVVATEAGGTAEAIHKNVTGLVSKFSEPNELATLVCSILSNPKIINNIKEEGPRFVRKNFGLDAMIASTLQLYNS